MISYRELWQRRYELLFKKDYGRAPLYAKIFCHRLTPALVWCCARLGLRPNTVTAAALITGLAGCALWTSREPWVLAAGAALLELYYLLDSVDGQLARLTRVFSKSGAFFDILGNYMVQPLVFIALGVGSARSGGGWEPVLCGAAAALGLIWLGLQWEVRGNLLYSILRKEGCDPIAAAPAEKAASGASPAKAMFSFLHKLCTFPTLLNVLTLSAVAAVVLGSTEHLNGLLVFYAITSPLVASIKALKMFASGEIDREYQGWRR